MKNHPISSINHEPTVHQLEQRLQQLQADYDALITNEAATTLITDFLTSLGPLQQAITKLHYKLSNPTLSSKAARKVVTTFLHQYGELLDGLCLPDKAVVKARYKQLQRQFKQQLKTEN